MSTTRPADSGPAESPLPDHRSWHRGLLVRGHGVASGMAPDTPYPAGTIALQRPLFASHGLDLTPFQPATLNLNFPGGHWRLSTPDLQLEQLRWSDHHPPETFSFWHCRLRRLEPVEGPVHEALIYHPHPETKQAHHQPASLLELLAPPLGEVRPGEAFAVEVDPRRCQLIQPARLRARLLEFLKFRVLAAQAAFFADFRPDPGPKAASPAASPGAPAAAPDLLRFRAWLRQVGWSEALVLEDDDLARVLDQARRLYTEESG